MAGLPPSPAFNQYIDDELLRAPMLFDQLAQGAVDQLRRNMVGLGAADRSAISDLLKNLNVHRARLAQIYTNALRDQATQDRTRQGAPEPLAAAALPAPLGSRAPALALVEEDEVAVDVELSHTVEYIKTHAEHELRELRSYVAALVGDIDVSADHNPFRPEVHARALWAAAQSLPASPGWRMNFMRQATGPLAAVLRQSYAAASSRLEAMGVEPASHRTVITTSGARRSAGVEQTYTPDLYRMRETMLARPDEGAPLRYEGQQAGAKRRDTWVEVAQQAPNRLDRQAIELVGRLFDAIATDERVPADVALLIGRLHSPAMRLTLRDAGVLDQQSHPLWRFIHLVTYEAEMAPDAADPERRRLLRLAQQLIDQIAADPDQRTPVYRRAVAAVEEFLRQRLQRRLTGTATQVGALQKLEHQLLDGGDGGPDTIGGAVDLPVMDAGSAGDVDGDDPPGAADPNAASKWLVTLDVGTWVRLYLGGRWVHAQLLWTGERGEVWLFGDGASDATWAVRRGALLRLHAAARAKTLAMRSLLGRAALKVQQQVAVQGGRH
jgi:hypothetical protein